MASSADIHKALTQWRDREAAARGVDSYRVLQNRTIDELSQKQPTNKDELLDIYGIGDKKAHKYSEIIFSIISGDSIKDNVPDADSISNEASSDRDQGKVLSVSDFIRAANAVLRPLDVRVQGEVTEISERANYLFFTIKDSEDEGVLECFMSRRNFDLSGVELEQGMEIIIEGYARIYAGNGRFSFQTLSIELVGEGALRLAYEKLKAKLSEARVFAPERKRELPKFPRTIGLITSRGGAVKDDIINNLGRFGFQIRLYDARVEGKRAIKSLVDGLEYFTKEGQRPDVIVIARGGGDLEAFQAFNSEAVTMLIAKSSVPILASLGHHKDEPLSALAADLAVSTPTAAATILNEGWQELEHYFERAEIKIMGGFERQLSMVRRDIDASGYELRGYLNKVAQVFVTLSQNFDHFVRRLQTQSALTHRKMREMITNVLQNFSQLLVSSRDEYNQQVTQMVTGYEGLLTKSVKELHSYERDLDSRDPKRRLEQGYSIVRAISSDGKVVKSVQEAHIGDKISAQVSDGTIFSEVTDTKDED